MELTETRWGSHRIEKYISRQSLEVMEQEITDNWITVVQNHIGKFPFDSFNMLLVDGRGYYLTKLFNGISDKPNHEIKYCHQMHNKQIAIEVINHIMRNNENVTLLPENSYASCKLLIYKV